MNTELKLKLARGCNIVVRHKYGYAKGELLFYQNGCYAIAGHSDNKQQIHSEVVFTTDDVESMAGDSILLKGHE